MKRTNSLQNLIKITGTFIILIILNSCENEVPHSFVVNPYVQNVTQHGITISWEASETGTGTVYFWKDKSLKNKLVGGQQSKLHEITIDGLDVETKYYYQVESNGKKSAVSHFNTAVKKDSPFSFVVYGDNKNGPTNHEKIANLISGKDPKIVLHVGDLVERGGYHNQWLKLFFTPAQNMINHIPLFTLIGNHEDNDPNYYNFFNPPSNDNGWYSFDYGNAHFTILQADDSGVMIDDSTQIKWLIQDLEKNKNAAWKFVLFHKPPFSSGGQHYVKYRLKINKLLVPLFNKYGVDMVFNGDDHHYERTLPIGNADSEVPTTYVVCGNGGTTLRYVNPSKWTKKAQMIYGFNYLTIEGSKLHFKHITINNDVLDEFVLDKNDALSVADYKKEMLIYDDIVDVNRDVADAVRRGRKLLKADLYEEAIAMFEFTLKNDPNCHIAKGQMAECYAELGEFEKAEKLALEAMKLIPNFPNSYEAMIMINVEKENFEKALKWCDRLEAVSEYLPDANEARAGIYEEMGDIDSAIKATIAAISIYNNNPDIHYNLAEFYGEKGDTAKMIAAYKAGMEWNIYPEDEDFLEVQKTVRDLEE